MNQLTPSLPREIVRALLGTVRAPSGRREGQRGRTDPFLGSPGPPEQKKGGHQRKKGPFRPSSPPTRWRATDGRLKAMVTRLRRTMAPVCPLSLSRWETRPIIGTDRPTKGFRTAPRPCWAKRNQHLGIASVIMPTVGDKLSEPEKCARGPGMHRADRGHHCGHSDGRLALKFDAA